MPAAAATKAQQLQVDTATADKVPSHPCDTAPSADDESSGGVKVTYGPYLFTCLDWPVLTSSQYDTAHFSSKAGALHCQLVTGLVVAGRYKILTKPIGQGSHGAVYRCQDLRTGNEVALKARVSGMPGPVGACGWSEMLDKELDVYLHLGAHHAQPPLGIPAVESAGVHTLKPPPSSRGKAVRVSYIAMQLLGPSLWRTCRRQASRAVGMPRHDVVQAGKSMLQALASLHSLGYVHRDVKTENFCSSADSKQVVLIDYGFAREAYGYSFTKYEHCIASFVGTPNYSSLNSLSCCPQTPRDDLEALVYCLVEMEMPGCLLPWNNALTTDSEAAKGWSNEQLAAMRNKKQSKWQCAVKEGSVPNYLCNMAAYVMQLQPCEVPDYAWLMACLQCGGTNRLPPLPPQAVEYSAWGAAKHAAQHGHAAAVAAARHHILAQLRAAAAAVLPPWVLRAAAVAAAGYTISSAATLDDTEVLDDGDDDEGCDGASCDLRMSQCSEVDDAQYVHQQQQYERYQHEQQQQQYNDDDADEQQQQHYVCNGVPAAAAVAASQQPRKRHWWEGGSLELAGGTAAADDVSAQQAVMPDEQCDSDGGLLEEPLHCVQQAKRCRMALWHTGMAAAVPSGSDGSQPCDGDDWDT